MRVGVIGGGTMGIGIAHRFAASGARVTVVDVDIETAEAAVGRVAETLSTAEARGKLDRGRVERGRVERGKLDLGKIERGKLDRGKVNSSSIKYSMR